MLLVLEISVDWYWVKYVSEKLYFILFRRDNLEFMLTLRTLETPSLTRTLIVIVILHNIKCVHKMMKNFIQFFLLSISYNLLSIFGGKNSSQIGSWLDHPCRHENSRRHHRRAWGTIKAEVRNQTDAVYLIGPFFSDFGPKLDFFGQKGPKMVWFCTQKSEFEQNGMR